MGWGSGRGLPWPRISQSWSSFSLRRWMERRRLSANFLNRSDSALGEAAETPGEVDDALHEDFLEGGLGVEVVVKGLGEGGVIIGGLGGQESARGGGQAVFQGVLRGFELAFGGGGAGGFQRVETIGFELSLRAHNSSFWQ